MCTRMSMDIRVHIGRNPRNQLKISRRDSWSNHAPWLDHDLKINCSNALNFMTSTDAIAAKNAFVLITNLFVIKTNAFFAASVRAVMKIQSIGAIDFA